MKKPEEIQEDDNGPQEPGEAKLSKGQQKKLREKRKKQKEAALLLQKKQVEVQKKQIGEEIKVEQKGQDKKDAKKGKKEGKKMNAAALLALKAAQKKRLQQQEFERQRLQFEREQKRLQEEAREAQRKKQEQLQRIRQERRKKKLQDKKKGIYVSENNKLKAQKLKIARQQFQKLKKQQDDSSQQQNAQQKKEQVTNPNTQQQKPQGTEEIKVVTKVQPEKEKPKKYQKKKQKTIEQVYQDLLKQKQQKLRRQQQQKKLLQVKENWQQLDQSHQIQSNQIAKKIQSINNQAQKPKNQIATQKAPQKVKKPKKIQPMEIKKEEPELKILKNQKLAFQVEDKSEFRSPICCILGHVDTGKTTLLDKIRHTNVQEGEAGGITQQIGATFFPKVKLVEEINKCSGHFPTNVNVPGLLIIDTPGHQSFANLRSRGSSLCDIAILVIDLMHGLQNQTVQSIELLRERGTPFVVALNKIDRTYDWKSVNDDSSYLALKRQQGTTLSDYNNRLNQVIVQMNQKGFNTAMYWENQDPTEYVSLVPTSGVTGQGIPDLLSVLVKYCLTISSIKKRVKVSKTKFNCTVMQVKMIEGHGTTIDCILVDGKIKKDDQIVLLGFNGPIVTKVKALLTPHPMKQMRIKDEYLYHDEIVAANGVKISAPGLDQAVAGTPLLVANTEDQVDTAMDICQNEYENIKKKIKLSNLGVGVAASTLGSLEALLDYLNKQKIPVSYVSVGPVSKDDVLKAMKSLLSQNPQKRRKEYCCLLVFDVKVLADAQKFAQQNDIRIFTANIIYHLTDHFNKFVKEVKEERKINQGKDAVFPCILKQVATFRKNDPIVLGVDVQQGVIKIGTPLCVYSKQGEKLKLGVVQSIQSNHKKLKQARKVTGSVAIQIGGDKTLTSGRHFQQTDKLASIISRKSIDLLKEHFRDQVSKDEWQLIIELKNYFKIS